MFSLLFLLKDVTKLLIRAGCGGGWVWCQVTNLFCKNTMWQDVVMVSSLLVLLKASSDLTVRCRVSTCFYSRSKIGGTLRCQVSICFVKARCDETVRCQVSICFLSKKHDVSGHVNCTACFFFQRSQMC